MQFIQRFFTALASFLWLFFAESTLGQTFTAQFTANGKAVPLAPLSGAIVDVKPYRRYAFISESPAGIIPIDLNDYAHPVAMTSYATGYGVNSICLSGATLFGAAGKFGIYVYDATQPSRLLPMGTYATGIDMAASPLIAENWLFFSDGTNGVRALDISIPASPTELYRLHYPLAVSIAANSNVLAVLTAGSSSSHIYLHRASNGAPLGDPISLASGSTAKFAGDYLFVSRGSAGTDAYYVSYSGTRNFVSSFASGSYFTKFEVSNAVLYQGSTDGGLLALSYENPSNPTSVGSYNCRNVTGVSVSRNRLAVTSEDAGLFVFDVSDPADFSKKPVGRYDFRTNQAPQNFTKLIPMQGAVAVLKDGAIAVWESTNRTRLGSVGLPATPSDFAMKETLGVAACGTAGIVLCDFSDLMEIEKLGALDTPGAANGVAVLDHFAYVAAGSGGLEVADISDPRAPRFISSATLPGAAISVAAEDGIVAVSCGDAGVVIFEAQPNGAVAAVGSFDSVGSANAICLRDKRLFIADGSAGVAVVNLIDPTHPTLIAQRAITGGTQNLSLFGNLALVASGSSGASVVDVADPQAKIVGAFNPGEPVRSAVAFKDDAYFATPTSIYFTKIKTSNRIVLTGPVPTSISLGDSVSLSWRYDGASNTVWLFRLVTANGGASVLNLPAVQTPDGMWQSTWHATNIVPGCNYSLRVATRNFSAFADSNGFCVLSPSVVWDYSGDQLRVSWSTQFKTFSLWQAPMVNGPWNALTNGIFEANSSNVFLKAADPSNVFYRLQTQ